MIYRQLAEEIIHLKKFYPIITITGPRQSGKTTLCHNLFPNYEYFNLEDAEVLENIKIDPKKFLRDKHDIIIDEIHNYPEVFSLLQVIVDENRDKNFILTGSSNFSLLQNITQSLAGRTAVLTLLPLSLNELGDIIQHIGTDALILSGGYPQLWSVNGFPRNTFYRNYYTTYVERDVRQIINIRDMTTFQKFIRLCAGRIGTEFNASNISNETGVSVNTVISWMSLLSASYIAYQLPPYFTNIGKRLVKTPKLYFYDTGLACYLLNIENEIQLSTHPLRGNLFENMVINEAVKSRYNRGKDSNIYFYRDKSGNEVDLVCSNGDKLDAYEIKSAQTFTPEYFKSINYIKKLFGDKIAHSTVIYDGEQCNNSTEHGLINFRDLKIV